MLFLLFQLGADRYALPAHEVSEVLPLVALKEIPGAPRGVAGLMNHRGVAVPVVDLSALALGRPAARRVSTRLVMVHYAAPGDRPRLLGLVAEHATEMMRRAPEEFRPAGVDPGAQRYLGPVVADGRGLIQRVEVAALLNAELRSVLFRAADAAAAP